jgi:hypothetical protein
MPRITICFGIALGLLFAKPIPVKHGTLILGLISRKGDYVVIGAESRNRHMDGKPSDDEGCKVIALGNKSLFFEAGVANLKVSKDADSWNALTAARAAYRESKIRDAEHMSIGWAEIGREWFSKQSPQALQQVAIGEDGRIITGGFLSFTPNGSLTIRTEAIFYSEPQNKVEARPDPPIAGAYGQTDANFKPIMYGVARHLIIEYFDGKTPRAVAAFGPIGSLRRFAVDPMEDSESVRKAIQFAIDYATPSDKAEIGGPIDVAILRKDRTIQWVNRKSECYNQDQKPIPRQ